MGTTPRRKVTRAYVWMIIVAAITLAVSFLVFAWGMLRYTTGRYPVETEVTSLLGPLTVVVIFATTTWSLWRQSLTILRGSTTAPVAQGLGNGLLAYVIWSVVGSLAGLRFDETWMSMFALVIIPIVVVVHLLAWAVLVRKVYTDRPTPQWPWERAEASSEEP